MSSIYLSILIVELYNPVLPTSLMVTLEFYGTKLKWKFIFSSGKHMHLIHEICSRIKTRSTPNDVQTHLLQDLKLGFQKKHTLMH